MNSPADFPTPSPDPQPKGATTPRKVVGGLVGAVLVVVAAVAVGISIGSDRGDEASASTETADTTPRPREVSERDIADAIGRDEETRYAFQQLIMGEAWGKTSDKSKRTVCSSWNSSPELTVGIYLEGLRGRDDSGLDAYEMFDRRQVEDFFREKCRGL